MKLSYGEDDPEYDDPVGELGSLIIWACVALTPIMIILIAAALTGAP